MASPRTPRRAAGPAVRRQPQRTCVSCRETGDKRSLTRLVRSPDGHVHLDAAGRAPGRGAYLCTRRECWERALGRADVLGRALKMTVPAEDRTMLLAEAPTEPIAPGDQTTDNQDRSEHAGNKGPDEGPDKGDRP